MKDNKYEELDALYAKLPKVSCIKGCCACCGPVFMTKLEKERLLKRTGKKKLIVSETLKCPLISPDNQCSVYNIRPLICRLFGVVKRMQCPMKAPPERLLSDEEEQEVLDKIKKMAEQNGGVETTFNSQETAIQEVIDYIKKEEKGRIF